jgi:predicted acyltransferase
MSATALNPQVEAAPAVGNSRRLLSLDALRGLTIAFMIMVNNNGSSDAWGFMKHADWNGMTPTDLVFPTFVFVVGASVVFAFEARLARGATRVELAWQTVRRAAILFGLGIVVNGFPYFPLGTLRIYGVLQRIAVCYLVAALLYLWDRRWQSKAVVVAVALIGYWIVMRWVPVPGLGLPGRDIPFLDKDANMVAFLDRHILPGRLYEGTRDPEGLLSDLPAVGTVLLGMLAGIWLRSIHSLRMKAVGLAGGAATLLALGSLWSLTFPLNKKLWTSSYVLVAAGISMAVLALFFWAIEVSGWRGKWTWPWLVLGSNAIFAYMLSELITGAIDALAGLMGVAHFSVSRWVFLHGFAWIPDQGLASFAYSVVFLLVCFVPTWVLYRNKIFLKV